jgi:hypothetical protein
VRGRACTLLGLPCIFEAKTGSHFMYGAVAHEVPVRRPFSCLRNASHASSFLSYSLSKSACPVISAEWSRDRRLTVVRFLLHSGMHYPRASPNTPSPAEDFVSQYRSLIRLLPPPIRLLPLTPHSFVRRWRALNQKQQELYPPALSPSISPSPSPSPSPPRPQRRSVPHHPSSTGTYTGTHAAALPPLHLHMRIHSMAALQPPPPRPRPCPPAPLLPPAPLAQQQRTSPGSNRPRNAALSVQQHTDFFSSDDDGCSLSPAPSPAPASVHKPAGGGRAYRSALSGVRVVTVPEPLQRRRTQPQRSRGEHLMDKLTGLPCPSLASPPHSQTPSPAHVPAASLSRLAQLVQPGSHGATPRDPRHAAAPTSHASAQVSITLTI